MSAFELDHAGVGARDLAPLAASYERLGFTLTPVARHRGKATGNRCAMLQRGYIELFALLDPAIPDPLHAQLERYAGLHIVALGMEDSAAEVERLEAAGFGRLAVAPLERPVDDAEPHGPQARFERVFLPDAPEGNLFLIRHLTRAAVWQEHFLQHANNAVALDEVVLAVADPAETAARLSRFAGLPLVPDAVAGFALPMGAVGGRVRVVPAGAVGEIYPGVTAPAVPCVAGMTVRTSDGCASLRAIVSDVPHVLTDAGLCVLPGAAGGAALSFI